MLQEWWQNIVNVIIYGGSSVGFIFTIVLSYMLAYSKIKHYEDMMDKLYSQLWTKIKHQTADPSKSMIVINSRIENLKEEYHQKIDHLEQKRNRLLKLMPLMSEIYEYKRKKNKNE
ncbi:MAG: hypothetical protein R3251_04605 [Candidatus Spechtbacterales bacterium]|nr:hypothetical protein [Candidatus Spechtbacterales bacterium]